MKRIIALVVAAMFASAAFAADAPKPAEQAGKTVKHQPAKKKMKVAHPHKAKKAAKPAAAPAAK